jgi:hypothetical protein
MFITRRLNVLDDSDITMQAMSVTSNEQSLLRTTLTTKYGLTIKDYFLYNIERHDQLEDLALGDLNAGKNLGTTAFSQWNRDIDASGGRQEFYCSEKSSHLINNDRFNLDCYIYPSTSTSTEVERQVPIAKAISAAAVPAWYLADIGTRNKMYTQRV